MNEKNLFPDYEPKTTPDTIYDYLRNPNSKVFEILKKIGQPDFKKLKSIIEYFIKYKIKAKNNPGNYQEGNILLGANHKQYYPSEEELLISELGKMIKDIFDSNLKKTLEKFKKKNKIITQTLQYNEICFRHVDVMGSGRFFYAEKKKPKVELRI